MTTICSKCREYKKGVMIVLYCEEQMMDLKSARKCQSMLAIDKTYNLGKWFVSSFTYKSVKVEVKDTRENPIMVGPILVHNDSSFETYHNFFSLVKSAIGSHQNVDELGISRNRPYIGGHLAFYFKLNYK